MTIIDKPINNEQLKLMLGNFFDDMVKGVVDVNRRIIAVDADLHADLESLLLQDGSIQTDLWGINIYPELEGEDYLEFDSMINIRPYQDNPGRDVYNPETRALISDIVSSLII
ncbi:MAG: hypothetical protein KBT08_04250 [Bacteroidales bacterium]|nr:hypothetical protein [Candidatus Cryptobacteroides onthequi]